MNEISVIGTVGVPATYGGFETLAQNLVDYSTGLQGGYFIAVYCSSKSYNSKSEMYKTAVLRYIPFKANGWQSVLYDIFSIFSALKNGSKIILLLGVSGAVVLPIIRLFSNVRVVTNVDGVEWKREKWGGITKRFLKLSEWMAVKFSNEIIADNRGVYEYIKDEYNIDAKVIAYGGEPINAKVIDVFMKYEISNKYALSICRIEPENNIHIILDAFKNLDLSLVIVGNWEGSDYGKRLKNKYSHLSGYYLLDPIYDQIELKSLRGSASFYIHGHSAGGTNPSLVEAMHFGIPVVAFDCTFNRHTTENQAFYFKSAVDIGICIKDKCINDLADNGSKMLKIAKEKYVWRQVTTDYYKLLCADNSSA